MSCCLLKHRYIATYSRNITTIYRPPYLLYASFSSRHLFPHPLLPLPSIQTTSNMSTSEEAGYSGQAEVFHAPQSGCPRDRESSLEIPRLETGEPPEAGSGDETEDGAPLLHPFPPPKRVDSPVCAEKTDQPPADSGASRRQLSPALRERHQLPPPRSTGHHRRHLGSPRSTERHPQSSRDRGGHADANQTIARRRRFDEDIEQAKTAAREASLVAKRAQQALAQSVASAAAGATAALLPSSRPQGVASQRPRPGNNAIFKGIVACMASAPSIDFSSTLATAVVETTCALRRSERPASRQAGVLSGSGLGSRGLYGLC